MLEFKSKRDVFAFYERCRRGADEAMRKSGRAAVGAARFAFMGPIIDAGPRMGPVLMEALNDRRGLESRDLLLDTITAIDRTYGTRYLMELLLSGRTRRIIRETAIGHCVWGLEARSTVEWMEAAASDEALDRATRRRARAVAKRIVERAAASQNRRTADQREWARAKLQTR
ncbi:MAG: hypothetical protein ACYTFI_08275 [Planctomycetota bacterium]|jgi:hypothetical protein